MRKPACLCKWSWGIGYTLLLMRSSKPFTIVSVPLENYQLNLYWANTKAFSPSLLSRLHNQLALQSWNAHFQVSLTMHDSDLSPVSPPPWLLIQQFSPLLQAVSTLFIFFSLYCEINSYFIPRFFFFFNFMAVWHMEVPGPEIDWDKAVAATCLCCSWSFNPLHRARYGTHASTAT